jgi:hypothetical protein
MDKKILEFKDLVEGEVYVTAERNPGYVFEYEGSRSKIENTFYVKPSEKGWGDRGDLLGQFGKYMKASDNESYILRISKAAGKYKEVESYSII